MKLSKLWLLTGALIGTGVFAPAQQQDWPVHRQNQDRTGVGVTTDGPNQANLTWWWPRNVDRPYGQVLDVDSATLPSGIVATPNIAAWTLPATKLQATGYYGTGGYLYTNCVAALTPDDPTSGATATMTWTLAPPANNSGQYALYVQFPTSGTTVNGVIKPNALNAIYKVTWTYAGQQQSAVYRVEHTVGGSFVRVGDNALFPASDTSPITITLYNTVPVVVDINGQIIPEEDPSTVIVCADAAEITIGPATTQTAPIVMLKNGNPEICFSQNLSVIDPNDPSGSKQAQAGEVVMMYPPGGPLSPAIPKWRWSPSEQANVNVVIDDTSSSFHPDSGFTPAPPPLGVPDWYATSAYESPVAQQASEEAFARWEPQLTAKESFDIYAWFPSQTGTAVCTNHARYVIHYYDGNKGLTTDTVNNVDQENNGGHWVKIGTRSYPNDPDLGQMYVQVYNYTDPGDIGRVVTADAVMFVGAYQSSITVHPGRYTVNVAHKGSQSPVPTDVVFAADQSGHVFMLDANGDGAGHTWAYWAYPSIPNVNKKNWTDPNATKDNGAPPIGAFIRTSVAVGKVKGNDAVFIGSTNGRMYALDIGGRGDYDDTTETSGTTKRLWTYPDSVPDVTAANAKNYGAVVAGVPAIHNGTVYFPTTEGRVYALKCDGDGDGTTTEDWVYPDRALDTGVTEQPPYGAIQGPVSYVDRGGAGDLVVFATSAFSLGNSGYYSGRVVAVNAKGGTNRTTQLKWVYPGATSSEFIGSFTYGGALYVQQVSMDGKGGQLTDVIYVGSDDGIVYCFDTTGKKLWQSAALGGAIRSAPTWAQLVPRGSTTLTPQDCVLVTTASGEAFALLAHDTTADGSAGKNVWGIQTDDSSEIFGGLAVSHGFMYGQTTQGRLLAFSNAAAANGYDTDQFGNNYTPVTQVTDTNGDTDGNDKWDNPSPILKRISKIDYDALRNGDGTGPDPYKAKPINNQVLEWGETVYLVLIGFHTGLSGSVTFQLKGPSVTPRGAGTLKTFTPTGTENDTYSLYAYTIEGTRQSPFTPGEQYWFEAMVRTAGGQNVGPFIAQPQPLTIANPIAFITDPTQVSAYNTFGPFTEGLVNDRTIVSAETIMNGTFDNNRKEKVITFPVSPTGNYNDSTGVNHGQIGHGTFWVMDRSLLAFSTGRSLRFIMGGRQDLGFSGGMNAVIKPLPWEIPPVGKPNPSPDYPDIDRRNINLWADQPNSPKNIVGDTANLFPPIAGSSVDYGDRRFSPVTTRAEVQVPIYQPANITAGYNNKIWIWVDTDGDRRPTGINIDGAPTSVDSNIPAPGAEAYRTLYSRMFIPPDEKIVITEPTVDLGELSGSTGFTPTYVRATDNSYFPSKWKAGQPTTFDTFFKPFTVLSYGNVNMLNLRVASQLHAVSALQQRNPFTPVAFYGDGMSPYGWMGADLTLVSNLDPRFSGQVTLHKPRPGDRSGTSLRLPDAPYGVQTANSLPPTLGVAVPIGQPSGSYKQYIRVFEDLYNSPNLALDWDLKTGQALETWTEPTMQVKFMVRETRLTSGLDLGTLGMFDTPPNGINVFRTGNGAPAAYRDKSGNLIAVIASDRTSATNTVASGTPTSNWSLYSTYLSAQGPLPRTSLAEPLIDLFKWRANNNNKWFALGTGPYPTTGTSLFTAVSGTPVAGTMQFFQPSFPVNVNSMKTPYVFWQGQVEKDSQGQRRIEYGIFYSKVNPGNGQLDTPIRMSTTNTNVPDAADAEMPRLRPIAIADATGGAKLLWYGASTDRYSLFVNETTGLGTGKWGVTRPITSSGALNSARDPYPVAKLNGDIDIVYAGSTKDRNTNEIFLSTYGVDDGLMDWTRMKSQGTITENAVLDTRVGNLWRTRGLDWIVRGGAGGQGFSIIVNGQAILVNPVFDHDNTVLRYESKLGGYVIVDPIAGTIQFPTMGPGPKDAVQVVYTPRTFRLTSLGNAGGHTEPVAFIDRRPDPDITYSFRANGSAARQGDLIPMDRYWLLYKRGGTNAGQLTALYMQTFRAGVQLPTAVAVGTSVQFIGGQPQGFYTIDYTRGKIYFTQVDLGKSFSVKYTPPPGTGPQTANTKYTVAWINEMDETAVPNQRGLAESQVSAFADPGTDPTRPGFIWLFWNSTRNGNSDVYFQTISPRFEVVPANGGQ